MKIIAAHINWDITKNATTDIQFRLVFYFSNQCHEQKVMQTKMI